MSFSCKKLLKSKYTILNELVEGMSSYLLRKIKLILQKLSEKKVACKKILPFVFEPPVEWLGTIFRINVLLCTSVAFIIGYLLGIKRD
jgi:hypothetical protein